jgi:hypothetical protein
MNQMIRTALLATATATALAVAAPTAAHADDPAPAAVSAQALPAYETWLADVNTVTGQAAGYLGDRLPDSSVRAAIVLDIDNTALQTTYRPGLTSPATPSVRTIAKEAAADGAAVFFVTARPAVLGWQTEINLKSVGYPVAGIYTRPWFNTQPDAALKTAARQSIEAQGYRIVANIGNNTSDLTGGYAERTFKLPDYDGQLA